MAEGKPNPSEFKLDPGLERFWINAPSALQPEHRLHGKRVLADPRRCDKHGIVYAYFTEGPMIACKVFKLYLSPGWPAAKPQTSAGVRQG